jgi:hypothetical protein
MQRDEDDADQMIGQDSFLDVVTNIVGILILLVMVVGMRASHAVETAVTTQRASSTRGRKHFCERRNENYSARWWPMRSNTSLMAVRDSTPSSGAISTSAASWPMRNSRLTN